jgi:hypothetical protein
MDIMSTQIRFVEVEPGKGGSKAKTIAINSTNKEEIISVSFKRKPQVQTLLPIAKSSPIGYMQTICSYQRQGS